MAYDTRLKLIENYIYFYHLDKFCILPLYPEEVTDSIKTNFSETNSLARSAPVQTFSNSGPRTVAFSFDLHRDLMNDVNISSSNLLDNANKVIDFGGDDYIDTLVKYLQAAALPVYRNYSSGSKGVIPPMIAIRLGNEIFIKGVVQGGVNITYKKPILKIGNKDKYARMSISFTVVEVDPYDAEKVVKVGSFRGICATNDIRAAVNSDRFDIGDYAKGSNVTYTDSLDSTINYGSTASVTTVTAGATVSTGTPQRKSINIAMTK